MADHFVLLSVTKREVVQHWRSRGLGYRQIVKITGLSKSTVAWHSSEKVRKLNSEARQRNRKKFVRALKLAFGGKCVRCGYDKCLDALHFHHKDQSTKQKFRHKNGSQMGVCALVRVMAYDKIIAIANCCELICANCHAEAHSDTSSIRLQNKGGSLNAPVTSTGWIYGYEDEQQSRHPVTVEIAGSAPVVPAIFKFLLT